MPSRLYFRPGCVSAELLLPDPLHPVALQGERHQVGQLGLRDAAPFGHAIVRANE